MGRVCEQLAPFKPKMSLKEIAEKYGTNIETIYRIDKGKTWAGVTGRKKLPEYDKLSHRKVCALKRALSRSFLSEKKLAENYNIKYSTLCDIRDGKTWEDA